MKNFAINKTAGFTALNVLGMGLPWMLPEANSEISSIAFIIVQKLLCSGSYNLTKYGTSLETMSIGK